MVIMMWERYFVKEDIVLTTRGIDHLQIKDEILLLCSHGAGSINVL